MPDYIIKKPDALNREGEKTKDGVMLSIPEKQVGKDGLVPDFWYAACRTAFKLKILDAPCDGLDLLGVDLPAPEKEGEELPVFYTLIRKANKHGDGKFYCVPITPEILRPKTERIPGTKSGGKLNIQKDILDKVFCYEGKPGKDNRVSTPVKVWDGPMGKAFTAVNGRVRQFEIGTAISLDFTDVKGLEQDDFNALYLMIAAFGYGECVSYLGVDSFLKAAKALI